jgi:hypothetical protein
MLAVLRNRFPNRPWGNIKGGQLRIMAGIGLSLLIHALLFLTLIDHRVDISAQQSNAAPGPLIAHLVPPATPAPSQIVASPPEPRPHPRPVRRKKALIARSEPAQSNAPVPQSTVPPASVSDPAPPMDMSTMINAARERRRAAEEVAAHENVVAQADIRAPSSNEIAAANIRHSLQAQSGRRDGTSGVFQVLSKGARTGRFIFRGWTPGARNTLQQTFEVDAGPGGDVELAIVRRMIELIRTHYTGDFHWDSRRLGRVIVQSARIEDSAGLEAFLMREFFSDDGGARG